MMRNCLNTTVSKIDKIRLCRPSYFMSILSNAVARELDLN